MNIRKLVIAVWVGLGVVIGQGANAATFNWNGTGVTGGSGGTSFNGVTNWASGNNLTWGLVPGVNDEASFGFAVGTPTTTISLDAPQSISRLSFPTSGNEPTLTIGTAADRAAGNTLICMSVFRGDNVGNWQTVMADMPLTTNVVFEIRPGYNSGVALGGVVSGGFGVQKWASGNLNLQGTNTYTGDTVVYGGTINIDFNTSFSVTNDVVSPTSTLVMNGGTLNLASKQSLTYKRWQTFNNVVVGRGASAFTISSYWNNGLYRLTLGSFSRNSGATLNFSAPTGNTVINADNGYTTSMANDGTGILGAYLTVGGNDWAYNNGTIITNYTGYWDLTGAGPSLPDDTTKNVRITSASTGDVGQSADTNTINSLASKDTTARTVTIGVGKTLRLGIVGGILTSSGTGIMNIGAPGNAGVLTAGGTDNTPGEIIFQNATTITNNAVIADNGSGAVTLTKSGSGTLVIPNAQTYSGATYVNAGTLLLTNGNNRLPVNGEVVVNGGTLNLGGTTQTVASIVFHGGITTNGMIIQNSNYDVRGGTLAAALTGTVALVKTSPGVLTLQGANTYTGDTTILEGGATLNGSAIVKRNLIIGSAGGIFPASVSLVNTPLTNSCNITIYGNGSLNFGTSAQNVGGTLTILGGAVTGGTQPYANSGMAVNMTGGSFAGTWYIADFNITSYATSITAYVSASLSQNHTFTVANGAAPIDLQFSGSFGGSGKRLTKAGPGVMAITSSIGHSASGSTVINGGTLLVNNTTGAGLGAAAVTNNAGCTLGGIGTIGGIANYSNANVVVTGSAGNLATLAPGSINPTNETHVIGTLTVGSATQTNNVTMKNYSRLLINFDSAGNFDRLVVNGTLDLSTTLDTIDLSLPLAGLNPGSYTLVTATNIVGTFNTVTNMTSSYTLSQTSSNIVLSVPARGTRFLVF